MDRNFLLDSHGDMTNAVLATVGYNFARLIAWLKALLCVWWLLTAAPHRGAKTRNGDWEAA